MAQTPDSVGRLFAPGYVQQRDPTVARNDDDIIKALEGRIRCTCGCNLDVFTCRTTDFTCATSPAMHRLVLARIDSGMTAEQVVASFEAQYGQAVLMQPPKRGFNWAAYVMPFVGLGVGAVVLGLAMRSLVRRARAAPAAPAAPEAAASTEELAELERELERFTS